MKVAIIGATGTIGKEVTRELLDKGHDVTAIARNPGSVPDHPRLERKAADIFDFTDLRAALPGHDALVVAFAPKNNEYEGYKALIEAAWRIKRVFKEVIPDAYFLNVGGASSLWTPRGFQMFEDPGWPQWFFNTAPPAHIRRLHQLSGFEIFRDIYESRERIIADPNKDPYSDHPEEKIQAWYKKIYHNFGKGEGGRAQLEFFSCDLSFRWSFVSPPWLLGLPERTGEYRVTIDTLPIENDRPAGISVADLALAIADTVDKEALVHQHWSAARVPPAGTTV